MLTVESVFEDLTITKASSNLYSKSPPVSYSNSASNEEITAKLISKSANFRNSWKEVWRSKHPQLQQRQNSPSSRNKIYNNEIAGTPNRVSHTSKNITSEPVRENINANSSTYNHLKQWLYLPRGNQAISQANSMTLNHSPYETYNRQLNLGRSLFASSPQVKHNNKVRRTAKIKIDNFRHSNKKRKLNYSASGQNGMLKKNKIIDMTR